MVEKPIFCVMNGELRRMVDESNIGLSAHPSDIDDIKIKFHQFRKSNNENLVNNIRALRIEKFDKKKLIDELTKLFIGRT